MSKDIDKMLSDIKAILESDDEPRDARQIVAAPTDIGYVSDQLAGYEKRIADTMAYIEAVMMPVWLYLHENRDQLSEESRADFDAIVAYLKSRGIDWSDADPQSWEVTYGDRADRNRPY